MSKKNNNKSGAAAAAADDEWDVVESSAQGPKLVCCYFLQGKCNRAAGACEFLHDSASARPCQYGGNCTLQHWKRNWQPDDSSKTCAHCGKEFGFFTKKHRCRNMASCGLLCADCLGNNDVQPIGRVCNRCAPVLAAETARAAAAATTAAATAAAGGTPTLADLKKRAEERAAAAAAATAALRSSSTKTAQQQPQKKAEEERAAADKWRAEREAAAAANKKAEEERAVAAAKKKAEEERAAAAAAAAKRKLLEQIAEKLRQLQGTEKKQRDDVVMTELRAVNGFRMRPKLLKLQAQEAAARRENVAFGFSASMFAANDLFAKRVWFESLAAKKPLVPLERHSRLLAMEAGGRRDIADLEIDASGHLSFVRLRILYATMKKFATFDAFSRLSAAAYSKQFAAALRGLASISSAAEASTALQSALPDNSPSSVTSSSAASDRSRASPASHPKQKRQTGGGGAASNSAFDQQQQQQKSGGALSSVPLIVSQYPTIPIFSDPAQHRGTFNNIAEWLFALPELEAAAVLDAKARAQFGAAHTAVHLQQHWQSQIAYWLNLIAEELENPNSGSSSYVATIAARPPMTKYNDPIAAATAIQQRLHDAVSALHALGVDPTVAADELASVLLYTSDLGDSRSIFAVANVLLRTCRAAGNTPQSAAQKLLAVYAPFVLRTDTFLARMPKQRRTLFRGVGFDFALQHYAAGSTVSWGQFSSSTTDVEVAQGFAQGKTLFVMHAGSTARVDFASVFPEEAETLLPSSSVFKSLGVTSPGLMRLLGQHGNLVQLRELGDDPTPQEVVTGMEEAKHALATLSDTFTESYVEARISVLPPPLPDNTPSLILFQELLPRFLERSGEFSSDHNHVALLGSGGTGKTSTLLALHTHISRNDHLKRLQQQQPSKPVISIFVALPKLPGDIQDGRTIDAQVLAELGARDRRTAAAIAAEATIVVLLDSLDECTIYGDPKSWRPLLDVAPFCRDHCRVIVSSRPEFADRLPSNAAHFVFGASCQQMHVLRLTAAAHDTYISKFVTAHNKELESHAKIHKNSRFTTFQVAERDVRDALDTLKLSADDQRLPVVLTMALEVALQDVRDENNKSASANSLSPTKSYASSGSEYCPPPGTRSHVMHRFLESRRTLILANAAEHQVDAPDFHKLYAAMQDVALQMLDQGDWNIQLGRVRSEILCCVSPCARESDNDRALRVFGKHVPCRVESIHDNNSLFGFWHKSLGEYLCARALFLDTTATITNKLSTAFSLREPNVCWFFNDLCLGDLPRRKLVTTGPLMEVVRNGKRGSSSSPANVSNAMALIACSDVSLDNVNLKNVTITDCNLLGANLSGAQLCNSTISKSVLRNAVFDQANITNLLIKDCEYNLKLPPLSFHKDRVNAVAMSPDSSRIASGSADRTVRIFDSATGRELHVLSGHDKAVNAVEFAILNGKLVLLTASSDHVLKLWDVHGGGGGRTIQTFRGHHGAVNSCTFSENGFAIASGGADKCVKIWRTLTGELVKTIAGKNGVVCCVKFAPGGGGGGDVVAAANADCTVTLFDVHQGALLKTFTGHGRWVRSLCFNVDGSVLVSGSDDSYIRTYSVAAAAQGGSPLKKTNGSIHTMLHGTPVFSVSFSSDGRLASGAEDIKLWDSATGAQVARLGGGADGEETTSVCFSHDGKVCVSGSSHWMLRVWNVSDDVWLRRQAENASTKESFASTTGKLNDGSDKVAIELSQSGKR